MAKDKESLEKSREERNQILRLFDGKVPDSIMKHNKSDSAIDLISSNRGQRSRVNEYKEHTQKLIAGKNLNPQLAQIFGHTPSGSRKKLPEKRLRSAYLRGKKIKMMEKGISKDVASSFATPGKNGVSVLSLFPQNIGRILINFYTKKGDIIIDPFAGHNSRMQLCWEVGRHYYGQDICHEFIVMNNLVKEKLIKSQGFLKNEMVMKVFEGDSRHLKFKDNFGDFTITSPPYWDLEYYGDEQGQLGFSKTYKQFLDELQEVMSENYRCLKKGAFCIWFVNDFRKNGKFYNYHGHTINRMRKVGFIQHDIMIIDLGSPIRSIFASQVLKSKILPKRHEYALIFKKE